MLASGSKITVEGKIYDVKAPKNIVSPEGYTGKPYNFWAQKVRIKDKEEHILGCDISFYHEADALNVGQTIVVAGVMGSWTGRDGVEHKDLQKAKVIEFINDVSEEEEESPFINPNDTYAKPSILGNKREPLERREGSEGYVDDKFENLSKEKPKPKPVEAKAKPVQKIAKPATKTIAVNVQAEKLRIAKDKEDKKWLDKDERISRCVALEHGCGLIKDGILTLGQLKDFIDEFVASSFHLECDYKLIDKLTKKVVKKKK